MAGVSGVFLSLYAYVGIGFLWDRGAILALRWPAPQAEPGSAARLRGLWGLAVPFTVSTLLVQGSLWAAAALVGDRAGLSEVALFNACNLISQTVVYVFSLFSAPLLPALAGARRRDIGLRLTALYTPAFFALGGVTLALVPSSIEAVIGPQYDGVAARAVAGALLVGAAINVFNQGIAREALIGSDAMVGLVSNMVWAAIFFGLLGLAGDGLTAQWVADSYAASLAVATLLALLAYIRRGVMAPDLLASRYGVFFADRVAVGFWLTHME